MTKSKHTVDLTQGTLWKQTLRFAIPLLLSNLLQLLYNTVDSVVVGNAVGTAALAAVGAGGHLIAMIVGFFVGFSTGASVVAARYFGAGNEDRIRRAVHTSFTAAIIGGTVMTLLCEMLVPPVLRLMHTPESVFGMAVLYLRLYFTGLLPMLLYNIGAGILRGVGDSLRPLQFLAVTSAVNVALDLLFVVVFRWGVAGAAVATVAAQTVACVLVLAVFLKSREYYRLEPKQLKIDRGVLHEVAEIGVPAGLQSVVASLSRLVVQSKINLFGELAMAGTAAYTKIDSYQALPVQAMGMTATTLIGQNLGAGNTKRARKGMHFAMWFCGIFGEVSGVLIFAFAPQLLRVFTQDAGAIEYGVRQCSVMAMLYPLCSLGTCMTASIRGAGYARVPMLISTAWQCVFRVIWCSVILYFWNDILAIYVSYPISWVLNVLSLTAYYYMRRPLDHPRQTAAK